MAPMEPAKAAEGLIREALEQALADHTPEQLRERAVRLSKSMAGMEEMLAEMEAEKNALREESEDLNNTITLMMQELHKLNIGAGNTVEPQLEEGPLDFVGRFWEKVKPRDTAYLTSEHVGEIRKPLPNPDGKKADVQQVVQEAGQQVVQTAQKIQEALGPWWARTQGFLNEKQNELAGAVAARTGSAAGSAGKQRPSAKKSSKRSAGYPEGSACADPAAGAAEAPSGAASSSTSSSPTASAATPAAKAPVAAAAPAELAPVSVAAVAEEKEEAPTPSGDRMPGAEEQISSTILIEAQLTIDDGSVLILHVRAADRCKEVAQRFVQDNSLKAWFQEPLTKWLKKVEADAVKFPVKVEGDLMEIRKQYSKSK